MKMFKFRALESAGLTALFILSFNTIAQGALAEPIIAEEETTFTAMMHLCWAALLFVLILFLIVFSVDYRERSKRKAQQ